MLSLTISIQIQRLMQTETSEANDRFWNSNDPLLLLDVILFLSLIKEKERSLTGKQQ